MFSSIAPVAAHQSVAFQSNLTQKYENLLLPRLHALLFSSKEEL